MFASFEDGSTSADDEVPVVMDAKAWLDGSPAKVKTSKISGILGSFGLPNPEIEEEIKKVEPQLAFTWDFSKLPEPRIPKADIITNDPFGYWEGYPQPGNQLAMWARMKDHEAYAMKEHQSQGTWATTYADCVPHGSPNQVSPWHMDEVASKYAQWMEQPARVEKPKKKKPGASRHTPPPAPPSDLSQQFHKTKLCAFYQKGLCTRGSKCTYAHYDGELEQNPDLAKTSICLAWKAGTCPVSSSLCRFAHGKHDMLVSAHKFPKNRQRLQQVGIDLLQHVGLQQNHHIGEVNVDEQ